MRNMLTEITTENISTKVLHQKNDDKDALKGRPKKIVKGSIVLNLGQYNASALSIILFTMITILGIYTIGNYPKHPLTKDQPLMDQLPFLYTLGVMYVLFCTVWGPRFMKKREPYKIKPVMKCYNLCQIAICSYMFYEFGSAGWFNNYKFTCEPVTYTAEPNEIRISSAAYMFFVSKIFDLLDTIFFVLNKKWEHISFLHIIHHSTMVINMWFLALYAPTGHMTFGMLMNSFIHALMYGYYFLSSLGPAVRPYLWWKRYLTVLQIAQIMTAFLHVSQVLWVPGCKMIPGITAISFICATLYIALFLDFYIIAYSKKTSRQKKNERENMDDIKKTTNLAEDSPLARMFSTTVLDFKANNCMKDLKMM